MISSDVNKFARWCDDMERRYDVMPVWYWNTEKRRKAFEATLEKLRKVEETNNGKTNV